MGCVAADFDLRRRRREGLERKKDKYAFQVHEEEVFMPFDVWCGPSDWPVREGVGAWRYIVIVFSCTRSRHTLSVT